MVEKKTTTNAKKHSFCDKYAVKQLNPHASQIANNSSFDYLSLTIYSAIIWVHSTKKIV